MTDDLKNKFISRRQLIKAGGLTAAGVAGAVLSADVEPAGVDALPGQVREYVAAPEVV